MANKTELLKTLYRVVEERTVEVASESALFPWFGGDVAGQLLLFSSDVEPTSGDLKGFRQVSTFRFRPDCPNDLPFEPNVGGATFVLGVLRGSEKDAPISRMVLDSFAEPRGEYIRPSEHLLVVDFNTNRAEYGTRPAADSSKNPIHLRSGSKRLGRVLEFWTDQIKEAPVIPQTGNGGIIIGTYNESEPTQSSRTLMPKVIRRILGK